MKHLIETTDLNSLGNAKYDRLILDSTKNKIIYRGGVNTNGHSYVDLGLPSGTLWATMNVGATSETAYGDYFMWGSVTPNTADECTWTNAPFNNWSSDFNLNYFATHKSEWLNDNDNLKPEFDAASKIMGGDWRMPTKAELYELINNTTNEWVTNYNGSGVNGRKLTSKKDTSKYIFIPAAGDYYNGSVYVVGDFCVVWSSSLDASNPYDAWNFLFSSDDCYVDHGRRCRGRSVRGVL